jgi:hypothetical protein
MMAAQTVLVLVLSVRYRDARNQPSLLHAFLRADPFLMLPQLSRALLTRRPDAAFLLRLSEQAAGSFARLL